MSFLFKRVRKYPLSCLFILFIWTLCLAPIPDTPMSEVKFIDKWTHLVFNKQKILIWIVVAPILMGGLIEIVQATCTGGNRSGDILDWVADSIGVILGQVIGIPLALMLSKNRKD